MNTDISQQTKNTINKLVNIQRQIIGRVHILRHDLMFPDDIHGIGLHWAHYVSKIQTSSGFTVITAINADADYSFCVAFGDKDSDLSPYRYLVGRIEPLWNLTEKTRPLKTGASLPEVESTNRFDGGCAPPSPAPLAAAGVRGEGSETIFCCESFLKIECVLCV